MKTHRKVNSKQIDVKQLRMRDLKNQFPSASASASVNIIYRQPDKDEIVSVFSSATRSKEIKTKADFLQKKGGKLVLGNGRPDTLEGKKQLRHVTPYCFIHDALSTLVKTELDLNNTDKLLNKLRVLFSIILYNVDNGYAFTDFELEQILQNDPISNDIKDLIRTEFSEDNPRIMMMDKENIQGNIFFRSPFSLEKQHKIQGLDKIQKQAKDSFVKHYHSFISNLIGLIQNSILSFDMNTQNILIDTLLSSYIMIFNKKKYTTFPQEGNTCLNRIKIITNSSTTTSEEFVTAQSLKNKIDNDRDFLKNNTICISNDEGSFVQKIKTSLQLLGDIMLKDIMLEDIIYVTEDKKTLLDKYNKDLNLPLSFSNKIDTQLLRDSNEKLSLSYPSILTHIAKNMFLAFDFKALEKTVFVPKKTKDQKDKTGINVIHNDKMKKYDFYDGPEYRAEQKEQHKYIHVEPRSEITDLGPLTKIAFCHFIYSFLIMSYNSIKELCNWSKICTDISKSFFSLVKEDYELEVNDAQAFDVYIDAEAKNFSAAIIGNEMLLI